MTTRAATERFLQALARLPLAERAALVLRFFDDLSEADTATTLGCSPVTVRSWTRRGLDELRAGGGLDDAPGHGPVPLSSDVPGPEWCDG